MTRITYTPWGTPDEVIEQAPGIYLVTTPSHGGFFVAEELRHRIPPEVVAATFNEYGIAGWYEEDFDWAFVACCFPEAFQFPQVVHAKRLLDGMWRNTRPHTNDKLYAALRALKLLPAEAGQ